MVLHQLRVLERILSTIRGQKHFFLKGFIQVLLVGETGKVKKREPLFSSSL